ncbi:MAG TPA: CpaD family pilus assembly protein [Rhodoblastus sp.]|nr:CpaD family pilus assembly protein [Rhodoblastus sp.]
MASRSRSALSFNSASRARPVAALLALALAAPLAGCGTTRVKVDNENGMDARLRHPIALMNQAYTIDVFPSSGSPRLDIRTQEQIIAFARRYRDVGSGPISIVIPQSGPGAQSGVRSLDSIRRELASAGAVAPVAVSHYPVENPSLAAPVRLAFDGLKAKVVHKCGDWPEDLASASSTEGWQNRSYWNFGCASQNMIATQVADPRDLAEPRGETPADPSMRMRAIGNVRKGADPATNWLTKNSSIGSVGG